jgi:hypothetical protein
VQVDHTLECQLLAHVMVNTEHDDMRRWINSITVGVSGGTLPHALLPVRLPHVGSPTCTRLVRDASTAVTSKLQQGHSSPIVTDRVTRRQIKYMHNGKTKYGSETDFFNLRLICQGANLVKRDVLTKFIKQCDAPGRGVTAEDPFHLHSELVKQFTTNSDKFVEGTIAGDK